MYTSSSQQQTDFISKYFPTNDDVQILAQMNEGALFIKKRSKTIIKRWKRMWVEGYTDLCWHSANSRKAMKITDIVKITPVKDLVANKKNEVTITLTFRHNAESGGQHTMMLVAPSMTQAQTWIAGLNKCRVASRAAEFTSQLRPRNASSPSSLSPSDSGDNDTRRHAVALQLPLRLGTANVSSNDSAVSVSSRPHQSVLNGQMPFSKLKQQLKSFDSKVEGTRQMASHDNNVDKELFDFVVVVQLRESTTNKGTMEPYISYTYPPTPTQKQSNQNILKSIPLFCFPDVDTIHKTTVYSGKTYSFILTDLNGERRHGYCLRMLPQGKEPRWPVTYCIISKEGCFQLFSEILANVEQRNAINNVAVFAFLKAVISAPFPAPGQSISVPVMQPGTGAFEKVLFERPQAETGFECVEFDSLFSKLSTQRILSIFTSLLFERRVIFLSNDISLLSSCIHACTSFLYPFEWIQILIPVLPKSLLSYVCSPIPFVVGVLQSHASELTSLPMEECVIVDLDTDRVQAGESVSKLPAQAGKQLQDALKQAKSNRKKITDAFLQFSVKTLGDYKKFLRAKPGGKNEFEMDAWIASKPKKDQPYYRELRQTQQFVQWVQEYEDGGRGKENSSFDQMIRRLGK